MFVPLVGTVFTRFVNSNLPFDTPISEWLDVQVYVGLAKSSSIINVAGVVPILVHAPTVQEFVPDSGMDADETVSFGLSIPKSIAALLNVGVDASVSVSMLLDEVSSILFVEVL